MTDLLERLETERDLCSNEHADDIAKLLDEAITEIERLESQCATHQMNQTNLKNENRNMARLINGKGDQAKEQSVELARLRAERDAARRECERLRWALKQYADKENWSMVNLGIQVVWCGSVDGAEIARAALDAGKGE